MHKVEITDWFACKLQLTTHSRERLSKATTQGLVCGCQGNLKFNYNPKYKQTGLIQLLLLQSNEIQACPF